MQSSSSIVMAAWQTFGSGDVDLIARQFTPDAEWLAPEGNATAVALACTSHMKGAAEIAAFIGRQFPAFFHDVEVRVDRVLESGSTVIVQERMTANLANGRPYDVDYCFLFDVVGDRIAFVREYMDTLKGWRAVFGDAGSAEG